MKAIFKTQTLRKNLLAILILALAFSYGCNSNTKASSDGNDSDKTKPTADTAGNAVPKHPDGMILVRGTMKSVSSKNIEIQTKDSTQTILLADSLRLYARSSSSLANVKSTSFIGVTTQKQADGSDQATEIHIFPEELRGLGEGSFIMDAQTGTGSRMTNGATSRMTNGAASPATSGEASRMSNGQVQKTDGTSLVVQYQGKSRTVKVPANTPVTAYTVTNQKLVPGVKVVALVKKEANGAYNTANILISGK